MDFFDIKCVFTPMMFRILDLHPNRQATNELVLTGRRLGGEECARLQVVDAAYAGEELQAKAMELARALTQKDRSTYTTIKRGLKQSLIVPAEATESVTS